ncbi:hypothetical protein [Streptomyces roseolus]|uniref:hypothetical protein n=1 Tax=Streptomyces roseolus TaxID=67358 RepID=UPI001672F3B0|nr:hypothetical protein [Streptomyces roseolus]GGR18442.1 hypothetical protein GCM10010282_08270 [Streptomyces roseolus]
MPGRRLPTRGADRADPDEGVEEEPFLVDRPGRTPLDRAPGPSRCRRRAVHRRHRRLTDGVGSLAETVATA